MAQPLWHIPDHFFNGVCICPCTMCLKKGDRNNFMQCIDDDCPPDKCGLKTMRMVA